MTTLLPAFGRNYTKASDAQRDWHDGKDFIESFERRAANIQDIPGSVVLRYGKQLEKVTSYDATIARKLNKEAAKIKAAAFPIADFDSWLAELNGVVKSLSGGLSIDDLPDWDFRAAHDAGTNHAVAAKELLAEAGFN